MQIDYHLMMENAIQGVMVMECLVMMLDVLTVVVVDVLMMNHGFDILLKIKN